MVVIVGGGCGCFNIHSCRAGPNPDRLLIGSEGILGIITEVWLRVQERPKYKASTTVKFESFLKGAQAVREISQ